MIDEKMLEKIRKSPAYAAGFEFGKVTGEAMKAFEEEENKKWGVSLNCMAHPKAKRVKKTRIRNMQIGARTKEQKRVLFLMDKLNTSPKEKQELDNLISEGHGNFIREMIDERMLEKIRKSPAYAAAFEFGKATGEAMKALDKEYELENPDRMNFIASNLTDMTGKGWQTAYVNHNKKLNHD